MSVLAQAAPVDITAARPRPLKRSASSASIASMTLPTPPPTRVTRNSRKKGVRGTIARRSRARSQSLSGCESTDDEEADTRNIKRRRLSQDPNQQTALWTSGLPALEEEADDNDNNSPAPHLFLARTASSTGQAPMSPPCSKRQTRASTKAYGSMASPPTTPRAPAAELKPVATLTLLPGFNPKPKQKQNLLPIKDLGKGKSPAKELLLKRDAAENPFLDSDNEDEDDNPFIEKPRAKGKGKAVAEVDTDVESDTEEWQEKPTIAYVFRGVRAQFANPLYAPPAPSSPLSPTPSYAGSSRSISSFSQRDPSSAAQHLLASATMDPAQLKRERQQREKENTRARAQLAALAEAKRLSELPIEHPDFEADVNCKPRLLFGVRPRRSRRVAELATAGGSKKKEAKIATASSDWS